MYSKLTSWKKIFSTHGSVARVFWKTWCWFDSKAHLQSTNIRRTWNWAKIMSSRAQTPTRNRRCDKQKQRQWTLRTCVLHFHTFLFRARLTCTNDVQWPNSRLCGQPEHLTINFEFSHWTSTLLITVQFLDRCFTFLNPNNLEQSRNHYNNTKLYLQITFLWQVPTCESLFDVENVSSLITGPGGSTNPAWLFRGWGVRSDY